MRVHGLTSSVATQARHHGHRTERAPGLRVPQRGFHDLGGAPPRSAIEVRTCLLPESIAVRSDRCSVGVHGRRKPGLVAPLGWRVTRDPRPPMPRASRIEPWTRPPPLLPARDSLCEHDEGGVSTFGFRRRPWRSCWRPSCHSSSFQRPGTGWPSWWAWCLCERSGSSPKKMEIYSSHGSARLRSPSLHIALRSPARLQGPLRPGRAPREVVGQIEELPGVLVLGSQR